MKSLIITNLFIFLLCINAAVLEIQIEGKHGWAELLPTWRPSKDKWYSKIYMKIMAGKELTGYHLSVFSLFFLIFHVPYFYGLPFTLDNWTRTLSLYFVLTSVWDFLWFSLNPHYSLHNFKKGFIPWHTKWIWRIPVDYINSGVLSILVLVPGMILHQNITILGWWGMNMLLFGLEALVVSLFSAYILKVHKWI